MKCCICGQEIVGTKPTVLFVGEQSDEKTICKSCEKKLEILFNSSDRLRKQAIRKFFADCLKYCADLEVQNFLCEVLRNSETNETNEKENRETESAWVLLLRVIASIEIIVGCIVSKLVGSGLGEIFHEPSIGVGITIVGFIISFALSSGIMVFLDMASDIRKIRQRIK